MKKQSLEDIHALALRRFDMCQSAMLEERQQCLEDRRFASIAGAQWSGSLGEQFENRPRLEFNKIANAINRIISEKRNNPVTVDFVSKDGEVGDVLADTLDGLYRADEAYSVADEAYDNAFEESVSGGFGAFRLRSEYEDELDPENENQRVKFEPITDADSSVFFDLNAKRYDKADAKYCFVISSIDRNEYEIEYQDVPASWPVSVKNVEFDWATPDVVYLAEYYVIEEQPTIIRIFETIDKQEEKYSEDDFKNDPRLETNLAAVGTREIRQRKIKTRKVHKYIMSGGKIIEDLGYIAGPNIPIVPVYGKRFFIDNIERCHGHVRFAKDAQRLKNMQLSKLAELSALSSNEKPIFTPEQIAGHQHLWAEDNIKNYPYLTINPIMGIDGSMQLGGPLGYTKPPMVPPSLSTLIQTTEMDMNDILGNAQQADQMISGMSGKAVELIQTRVDGQAYIYTSNFAKSMKRAGEIWLGMAKEIYTNREKMKIVGKEGESSIIEMMRPTLNDNGELIYENDISKASHEVVVDVGPSSSSKREATVRALTQMMQTTSDPNTMQILSALALSQMDGEGLSDARQYFRKQLIKLGVVKPNEQEMMELQAEMQQSTQPDAQQTYLLAAADAENAKATKERADMIKMMADADYTRAKTAEIASKIETSDLDKLAKLQDMNQQRQQPMM